MRAKVNGAPSKNNNQKLHENEETAYLVLFVNEDLPAHSIAD